MAEEEVHASDEEIFDAAVVEGLQNLVDIHAAVFGGISRRGVHTS